MQSTVLNLLHEYNRNPADLDELKEQVERGTLTILWEFNSSETILFYSSLQKIFNIRKIYYSNQISTSSPEEIDAVFILCPYDRKDRINVVKWGIENEKAIYVLEAGFLSSIYPLGDKEPPLSFHVDSTGGIYLQGDENNEIIDFLNSEEKLNEEQIRAAKEVRETIVSNGLSKYNFSKRVSDFELGEILVVDQTLNDFSIKLADSDIETFERMMQYVISKHPFDKIFIKVHPEVLLGIRKGNIDIDKYKIREGIEFITTNIPLDQLFAGFSEVYTVSSTLGFEALLYGKKVHVFGKCFYGGWGLTVDHVEYTKRNQVRKLEDLIYAIYLRSSFYYDVFLNRNAEPIQAIKNFVKLVQDYRANSFYADYSNQILKNKISVLEKEIGILQRKLTNSGTHVPVIKNNTPNKCVNKTISSLPSKVDHKIERKIIKFFATDERKFNKYLRDRRVFFEDSNNVFLKIYWNFAKGKE